jgi:hypothetical protein
MPMVIVMHYAPKLTTRIKPNVRKGKEWTRSIVCEIGEAHYEVLKVEPMLRNGPILIKKGDVQE